MFINHTKKRDLYYKKVISIYQKTGYGHLRISRMVPVSENTIGRWIANFVAENGNSTAMKKVRTIQSVQVPAHKENEDVAELRTKVSELEEQLKYQEMRADAYDLMIDIAEKKFNIPIRKKAGVKQ